MTTVLIIILAIILLAIAYLLFMPITLYVNINRYETTTAESALNMFPFHIQLAPRKKKEEKPKKEKPPKPEKPPVKKEGKFKFEPSRLSDQDLGTIYDVIARSFKYVGRLIKTPENGHLDVRLLGGVPQPDITGTLYGAYQAIRPMLPRSANVSYYPDFVAGKFTGDLSFRLSIRIFNLVKETIVFILGLPILRIIRLYKKYRKGGRDAK